jgi:putative flavoprotein involved in K+ transport
VRRKASAYEDREPTVLVIGGAQAELSPSESSPLHEISADLAEIHTDGHVGEPVEFYADAMEINCWTDTEFVGGTWDENVKCWTARLNRSDGTERIVRPRHLVFANGGQQLSQEPGPDGSRGWASFQEVAP